MIKDYKCPLCGNKDLRTWMDESQGIKYGRAWCLDCGCMGPEVRTGYNRRADAPWREEAIAEFDALGVAGRTNLCDNCLGPGLAIAHGIADMRVNKEVEPK